MSWLWERKPVYPIQPNPMYYDLTSDVGRKRYDSDVAKYDKDLTAWLRYEIKVSKKKINFHH